MNYLGIDWGKAKVGLAIGTSEMNIASPILILNYHNIAELSDKLKDIINSEQIDQLVVGQPVSLAGDPRMSAAFNQFVSLLEAFGKPIIFEDERMSTKYAASVNLGFKGHKKSADDDVAAAAILQIFLDRLNNQK